MRRKSVGTDIGKEIIKKENTGINASDIPNCHCRRMYSHQLQDSWRTEVEQTLLCSR